MLLLALVEAVEAAAWHRAGVPGAGEGRRRGRCFAAGGSRPDLAGFLSAAHGQGGGVDRAVAALLAGRAPPHRRPHPQQRPGFPVRPAPPPTRTRRPQHRPPPLLPLLLLTRPRPLLRPRHRPRHRPPGPGPGAGGGE
ncbi:hypothetical protein [Streptomyces sp. NPDC049949]|uniref:hypothetical protein n=1 Tax=Streptomyces sp. NPDC049949 TaxID=3154627 RepID=UPI00341988F9